MYPKFYSPVGSFLSVNYAAAIDLAIASVPGAIVLQEESAILLCWLDWLGEHFQVIFFQRQPVILVLKMTRLTHPRTDGARVGCCPSALALACLPKNCLSLPTGLTWTLYCIKYAAQLISALLSANTGKSGFKVYDFYVIVNINIPTRYANLIKIKSLIFNGFFLQFKINLCCSLNQGLTVFVLRLKDALLLRSYTQRKR